MRRHKRNKISERDHIKNPLTKKEIRRLLKFYREFLEGG